MAGIRVGPDTIADRGVSNVLLRFFLLQAEKSETKESGRHKRMERLRRSFRESFRRRKDHVPESSKPHQWQSDEAAVRAGTCNFYVKVREHVIHCAGRILLLTFGRNPRGSIYLRFAHHFEFLFFPVSGMRGSVRVTWYACLRGSTQSAQGKIFISIETMMTQNQPI
jgi:hypothetical protein